MAIPVPKKSKTFNSELPNAEWKKYNLERGVFTVGLGSSTTFEVYATVIDEVVYMKPTANISPSYEYEQLFDFGMGSENYDKNKIIFIPNEPNYYINFQ